MMSNPWIRVIRIRFLFSSVIAVFTGLAIGWWQNNSFDFFSAGLTLGGVLALHASVDLLNDYWDYKRGIDLKTTRTKMSGGTGVLPEGLLDPKKVYLAGLLFLIFGSIVGIYFVLTEGWIIGFILCFAIVSIYFYSTKIVDSGLAELFVTIKGSMIVLGTFFIQTNELSPASILGGILIGLLSSLVLFVTSFPDYEADKAKGRKTLVIQTGQKKATAVFWIFPGLFYFGLIVGTILQIFPIFSLIAIITLPLVVKSGTNLSKNYSNIKNLEYVMKTSLYFSRLSGTLLLLSFVIHSWVISYF